MLKKDCRKNPTKKSHTNYKGKAIWALEEPKGQRALPIFMSCYEIKSKCLN